MLPISHRTPPRVATWILRRVLPDESDSPVGDFEEYYHDLAAERGYGWARLWYWSQVLGLIPRRLHHQVYWSFVMLRSYLRVAVRTLYKHKGYAALNIAGLAVGIACSLLIFLFVRDEVSYDTFHDEADRIYRLTRAAGAPGNLVGVASTATAMGPALQDGVPGIETVVRFFPMNAPVPVRQGDAFIQEAGFVFADAPVFEMFDFGLQLGDPVTALQEPHTVVLSETTARKYFGPANPMGKTLTIRLGDWSSTPQQLDLTVTGVMADVPESSHLQFDLLASMAGLEQVMPHHFDGPNAWFNNLFYTYLLLQPDQEPSDVEAQFPAFIDQHMGEALRTAGFVMEFDLQPITDIHLHSDLYNEFRPGGNVQYVYIFSAVALFVLLLACINFMNLATARSATRAQEVGVRKVLGARRDQLIGQFIGESVLMTFVALVLAVGLVAAALPVFNMLSGKTLALSHLSSLSFWGVLIGTGVVVGVLAGSYPAFILSAFQPIKVLGGAVTTGIRRNAMLRRGLVVGQFAVTIVLIIATGVVHDQLTYLQSTRLGFDREQVVVIPFDHADLIRRHETIKEELLRQPGVREVSAASGLPGQALVADGFAVFPEGKEDEDWLMWTTMVDYDYFDTMGMRLVEGRGFSESFVTDSAEAFVLNEAAVQALGWTEDPIGKRLAWQYGLTPQERKTGQVIGVVEDYHYRSLHQQIEPLVLHIQPNYFATLAVRMQTDDMAATLEALQAAWTRVNPEHTFEYSFLDEDFARQYQTEQQLGVLFRVFAGLAVFIAILGLFGFASFSVQQRTKEIGIRKVMGASFSSIVVMLASDFSRLVGLALLLATPVAYVVMNRWLDTFAYHTDLRVLTFIASGLTAFVIAWLTVAYQSVKAARTNPVMALRQTA